MNKHQRKVEEVLIQVAECLEEMPGSVVDRFFLFTHFFFSLFRLSSRQTSRETVPKQQTLPPVDPPQVRIVSRDCVLLSSSCADNELVVGQDGDHPPKLVDQVRVKVTVRCGLNGPGVGAGLEGTLLLAVNYHVTRPKTGNHDALPRWHPFCKGVALS
jgi:hypothetical protein